MTVDDPVLHIMLVARIQRPPCALRDYLRTADILPKICEGAMVSKPISLIRNFGFQGLVNEMCSFFCIAFDPVRLSQKAFHSCNFWPGDYESWNPKEIIECHLVGSHTDLTIDQASTLAFCSSA